MRLRAVLVGVDEGGPAGGLHPFDAAPGRRRVGAVDEQRSGREDRLPVKRCRNDGSAGMAAVEDGPQASPFLHDHKGEARLLAGDAGDRGSIHALLREVGEDELRMSVITQATVQLKPG